MCETHGRQTAHLIVSTDRCQYYRREVDDHQRELQVPAHHARMDPIQSVQGHCTLQNHHSHGCEGKSDHGRPPTAISLACILTTLTKLVDLRLLVRGVGSRPKVDIIGYGILVAACDILRASFFLQIDLLDHHSKVCADYPGP